MINNQYHDMGQGYIMVYLQYQSISFIGEGSIESYSGIIYWESHGISSYLLGSNGDIT